MVEDEAEVTVDSDVENEEDIESVPGDEDENFEAAVEGSVNEDELSFTPAVSSTIYSTEQVDVSLNDSNENTQTTTKFLPWPHPFLTKNVCLRKELVNKIAKKEKLKTGDFTQISQAIFDECTKYT